MPTATVPPYLNNGVYALGQCTRGPVNSWTGARTATFSTTTSQTSDGGMQAQAVPGGRGVGYRIKRTFAWYDLATYTSGGNTISVIEVEVQPLLSLGTVVDAIIVEGTAFSTNTTQLISSTDINKYAPSNTYTTNFSFPNSTAGFNVLLNAAALSDANSNQKIGLCFLTYQYDYLGTDPYAGGAASVNYLNTMNFGAPAKVSLDITYASSGPAWDNSMNGIAAADIASINGIAAADLASINGIL